MRLALPLLLATTVALPTAAQERSLWELVHPDRIVTQLLQTGILALRSLVDLTYGSLDVSLAQGRIGIEGIVVDVPFGLAGVRGCRITAEGVALSTGDIFDMTRSTGLVELRGVEMPVTCFGPQAIAAAAFLPGGMLRVPELAIDYDWDLPSGALALRTRGVVADVAAVDLDVDLAYAWFRGEEPDMEPVVLLSSASVAVENLGYWEAAVPLLAPALADPESAAAYVQATLGAMLEGMSDGTSSKATKAFVTEMAEGMAIYAADPGRLVIESGFDADEPRLLDGAFFDALQGSPLLVIDRLEPRVGTDRAVERDVLSVALVRRAIDAPEALSGDEAREVGLAMLSGNRAPLDRERARSLLSPLAEDGDGEVALALARSLAPGDPEGAYAAAVAAGPTGAPGLRSMLDALEGRLPFATILRLQGAAAEPGPDDLAAPVAELRARAEAHLSGVGAARSLGAALTYASVAAARGDGRARRMLPRIEARIPADGAGIWAPVARDAAARATAAWLAGGR